MSRSHLSLEVLPELIQRWMNHLGLEVSARFEPSKHETLFPNRLLLEGKDEEWFATNRGQALDALQYLIHEAQGMEDENKLTYLDVRGIRLFRMQEVVAMGWLAGQKARELGSYTLGPLSPRERRWIHLTLSQEKDLVTESEGMGTMKTLRVKRLG